MWDGTIVTNDYLVLIVQFFFSIRYFYNHIDTLLRVFMVQFCVCVYSR